MLKRGVMMEAVEILQGAGAGVLVTVPNVLTRGENHVPVNMYVACHQYAASGS